jgi:hypothetical protein
MEESGQFHALTALSSENIATSAHGIGYWVDPRSCLGSFEKIKISRPFRESNHDYWLPSHRNSNILTKEMIDTRKSEPANYNLVTPTPKLS